ncbi:MAG: hypothetical protein AAF151_18030 [Cyanobacteria bacterium J06656_5]
MNQIIKFLAIITLIGSIAWLISDPGFEPALVLIGSISALVSAFVVEKRKRRSRQHQSISNSSMGIQAGGDVSIGDIKSDKHAK